MTLSVAESGDGDHVAAADEGPATAVIAKGATEAVFSVATVDDDADEADGSVSVTVAAGDGYAVGDPASGTVAIADDDAAALPSLSVADVTVKEGAWMEFTVRQSAPSAGGVSVKASTRDSTPVSATAGKDYVTESGRTVSFRAGETERSFGVIVYDDNHDEDPETFEVVLSDTMGAVIGDGVAVGTIENDDPTPRAHLARFGRAVAEQSLGAIADRIDAPRGDGFPMAPRGVGANAMGRVPELGGMNSAHGYGSRGPAGSNLGHLLLGSAFTLTGGGDDGSGSLALWGRGAQSHFGGRDGTLDLDGGVTTALLGADYAKGDWLLGVALAQSLGDGGYRDAVADGPGTAGSVESSLTAAIPYAAWRGSERLKLWGAAGRGAGKVKLEPGTGEALETDIGWTMAATGLRGALLRSSTGGGRRLRWSPTRCGRGRRPTPSTASPKPTPRPGSGWNSAAASPGRIRASACASTSRAAPWSPTRTAATRTAGSPPRSPTTRRRTPRGDFP